MDDPQCPACGAALRLCPGCGAIITARSGPGRPRRYCTDQCRWRAGHRAARKRARAAGPGILTDAELISGPGFLSDDELIAELTARTPDLAQP